MLREIVIPILNNEYKVIFTWGKPEEIKKVIKSWHHNELATIGAIEDRRGVTFHTYGCHPVIAMPRKPKTPTEIGTLAHEATHAVHYIYDMLGEEYRNSELFAHSVGAVVRGVLK
jgi:hypothetical protein